MTAKSMYRRGAFEPVERTTGRGTAMGLNCRKDEKNNTSSHQNAPCEEQTRHVLVGTINFHLMLVAIQNLVELVRSRRRLGGVATHLSKATSLSTADERDGSWLEQKVDVGSLLHSGRLVNVIFE